tara:strand:- start:149 stop:409 length:261 start_codon:yes stop_codon:yes gene_type:complete
VPISIYYRIVIDIAHVEQIAVLGIHYDICDGVLLSRINQNDLFPIGESSRKESKVFTDGLTLAQSIYSKVKLVPALMMLNRIIIYR